MKRTLTAIAYDILSTVRQLHDDSDIDIRLIKQWIKNSRSVWITNELNKFKPVPPDFIQDLGCADLVAEDVSLCGLNTCCKILRTNLTMPVFLTAGSEPAITRVGPTLLDRGSFRIIPYERVPFIGSGRYNQNSIYTFLYNEYIYVASNSNSFDFLGMRKINIRGVLADPEDAARFVDGSGNLCYTDSSNYPITDRLVTYLKDIVIRTDIKIMLSLLPDKFNNASDDSGKQQMPDSPQSNQQQQQ